MHKNLIIGYINGYEWDVIQYWVTSLNLCGFDGDKVLVVGENTSKEVIDRIASAGLITVAETTGINATPYVKRFYDIYKYIEQGNYNFVVTTDVRDVIFQKNPIEFLEHCGKDLVFSSESIKYKNEAWGTKNFIEAFGPDVFKLYKENEIFNVGVIAGKGRALSILLKEIFEMSMSLNVPICDQSTFNYIIQNDYYKQISLYSRTSDSWSTQMGTTNDPNTSHYLPVLLTRPPMMLRDVVINTAGSEFYIVHQYDRVPGFREILRGKYKS